MVEYMNGQRVTKLTTEEVALVQRNVPLAKFLARKRWEMSPDTLDFEELVSLANQGLVSAAQRWRSYCQENGYSEEDIVSGDGFSIFSRKRIIGSILDWQKRDADYVSRSYRTDFKIMQRAGYPDTVRSHEDLSLITGLTEDRIRVVLTAIELKPVSFHELSDQATDDPFYDGPVSSENVEESHLVATVNNAVADCISGLPPLQQTIMALRYFENLELQSISLQLNSSITFVREAHNAALSAVYEAMLDVVA